MYVMIMEGEAKELVKVIEDNNEFKINLFKKQLHICLHLYINRGICSTKSKLLEYSGISMCMHCPIISVCTSTSSVDKDTTRYRHSCKWLDTNVTKEDMMEILL